METNNTTTKNRRFRSSLRHMWDDQVAAHRVLLRLTPYFEEYRQNGR
jgi:hypothetical protein